ncbi:MAG: TIM barrel protein [Isosphaeraceae bacterium]|nr:TIM barrel protein [Isosphaeraceae bacterium]
MSRIGIMQGRLVPPIDGRIQCFPRDRWADEFELAAHAGLDSIEWIYDAYAADVNPIATDEGIDSLLRLQQEHGVQVASVCADYFMDRPLVRARRHELESRLGALRWLIARSALLGIERVVIPFVDASRIETAAEAEQAASALRSVAPIAADSRIELHLETSLGPEPFRDLLERLPAGVFKVNYDTGNSASLGYDPREEFAAYGSRVGSVHIKDRILGGGTVPLDTGDADLAAVFDRLHAEHYSGDIILQVARGQPGDEVAWAVRNRTFVLESLAIEAGRPA